MKTRINALERLKSGAPWEGVSEEFGKSTLYAALTEYFPWAESRVQQYQGQILQSEASAVAIRKDETELKSRVDALRLECGDLESHRDHLKEEVQVLSAESDSKLQMNRNLDGRIEELRKRGVTDEVVALIGRIDFSSKDELLARVGTFEDYQKMEAEAASLRDELTSIRVSIEKENGTLAEVRRNVEAECNLLDEKKRMNWMWQEAQEVMWSFFQNGYDRLILIGLKKALDALGVKGDPELSVKRLLDALVDVKELAQLESTLRQRRAGLSRTLEELDDAKGSLNAVKENVLKEIIEAVEAASTLLNELNSASVKEMQEQGAKLKEIFRNLSSALTADIKKLTKNIEASIAMTSDTYRGQLQTLNEQIQQNLQDYQEDIKRWGKTKSEMGAYADMILYGTALLGVLKDTEAIKELPPEIILQLADRILLWIEYTFPGVYTTPPRSVTDKELNLTQFSMCRLSSLVEWLRDDLDSRLRAGRP